MQKIWFKSYQNGIPHTIDSELAKLTSLPDLLEKSFKKFSYRPAFHCMGKTLSYQEIDNLSLKFASYLQHDLKLSKGDRVAIMMPNILQYPVALFGILRGGFVAVNVNPLYTPRELEHQLKDSGAKAIIIFENACHTLEGVLQQTEIKYVIKTSIGDMLSFPKSLLVNFVIKKVKKMVPEFVLPDAIDFVSCLQIASVNRYIAPTLTKDDLAFLQYTGGTTGVAKGAMLTHGNILANVIQAGTWISKKVTVGEEIIITPLPLYHIFSLTANCFTFSSIGGLNVLITNPRDIPGFVKELKKWKFTAFTGVNTLFNGLLNNPEFKKLDFSSLRLALGGGKSSGRSLERSDRKSIDRSLWSDGDVAGRLYESNGFSRF
jgi:long-chain acyl-CoA synthetase